MSHATVQHAVKAVVALVLGLLAACTPDHRQATTFTQNLEALARAAKVGDALSMASVNPAPWDRVFLFPPYTPAESIDAALGTRAPASVTRLRISERDDVTLWVFMNGSDVQLAAVIARGAMDWSAPKPPLRPIARDLARFVKQDADGHWALANPSVAAR